MKMTENASENRKYHTCKECGLKYTEKKWADKCETWCKSRKSCNLDIIKHAITNP